MKIWALVHSSASSSALTLAVFLSFSTPLAVFDRYNPCIFTAAVSCSGVGGGGFSALLFRTLLILRSPIFSLEILELKGIEMFEWVASLLCLGVSLPGEWLDEANITSLLFLTLECVGVGEAPITSLLCLGVTLLGEDSEDDIPSLRPPRELADERLVLSE